jgi:HopA1 effector protein family
MSNDLKKELRRILEALTIQSPDAFTLGGRRIRADGSIPYQLSHVPAGRNPFIAALQMQLYLHCYCRPFSGAISEPSPPGDGGKDLTAELVEANTGQERWEAGWRIAQALPSGQVAVQRNGLSRLLWPGEFFSPEGGAPRPGNEVHVFCRKHSKALQPGFYFVFGETLSDQQDESSFVRLYWNVQESGVLELVRGMTGALNRFQVPFRFKCLTRAGLYARSDAAVLYFAKRLYPVVAELLQDVYPSVAPCLRTDTPLFSRSLAPGLGLAEDPGNDESFGSHRCRLVAQAIWDAYALGRQTVEAWVEAIEKLFERNGLTLEAPYLNRGSLDSYDWPAGRISLS